MSKIKYKCEWVIIGIAVLWVCTSVTLDWYTENNTWFSRSGSIAVFLAVVVEYRMFSQIYKDIYKASVKQKYSGFATKPKMSKDRVFLSYTTHILLALGTLIWGYGDLIWLVT